MNINGRMKVKTLKSQFLEEFGLTLRVYDGRSFADDDSTLASIRKGDSKGGEFSPRKNTKVGNFENKIIELFGIKNQIAGSDDSYLCDNDITLAKALDVDAATLARREKKKSKAPENEEDFDEDEDLESASDFRYKAEELIEEGNADAARKYIEKGIAVAEDADDLVGLATVACSSDEDEGLGDKDWGRQIFEQAEKKLDGFGDIKDFAEEVSREDLLDDKKWAATLFKGLAKDAEDADQLLDIADSVESSLEDRELVLSLYRQAEGTEGADSADFKRLANLVAQLDEIDWAKNLYGKVFNAAEDCDDLLLLAEALKDDFDDRNWAYSVVKEAVMKSEDVSDLLRCAQTLACQFDDKEKARSIYEKALEKAEEMVEYQEITESVADEDFLGDTEWARRLADEHGFVLESDSLIIASMFETLEGRTRCRYYCAYLTQPNNTIAGYIAGYSGGGSFNGEDFYGVITDGEFESLVIDEQDIISGEEDEDFYDNCYGGSRNIFRYILEQEAYEDDFAMYLDETNLQEIAEKNQIRVTKREDMIFLNKGDADNKIVRKLCESIGLTSAPSK